MRISDWSSDVCSSDLIGSQMGHVGAPNRSLYCASKWALEGMNKAIALDLAPHRIRSNTIAPTFIETPLTKPFLQDTAFRDSVLAKIKLGRIGQPEDLMGAITLLASNAAQMMTGTSIIINAGNTEERRLGKKGGSTGRSRG